MPQVAGMVRVGHRAALELERGAGRLLPHYFLDQFDGFACGMSTRQGVDHVAFG